MASGRYVALLRGINVSGKNMLPMKELAAMFAAAGCSEVETYIQSGNVVFEYPDTDRSTLVSKIERGIEGRFGGRFRWCFGLLRRWEWWCGRILF